MRSFGYNAVCSSGSNFINLEDGRTLIPKIMMRHVVSTHSGSCNHRCLRWGSARTGAR
jgi:hypothetical protein